MKVIAEVGSNIKSFKDCVYSIEQSRLAGANIVKFQLLSRFDLYGEGSKEYCPLKKDWIPDLKNIADQNEIEFMCTGFSPEIYDYLNPFVKIHKIASAEITDLDILNKVASFKKPVILSTGGAKYAQIQQALDILKPCSVIIMYCVPQYPAKIISMDAFEVLKNFGNNYSYGYSDHSIDACIIPKMFKDAGATIIEKHVNFLEYCDTPDAHHALNFKELSLMCRILKDEVISLVDIDKLNNSQMREEWQRRLIKGKYLRQKP